MNKTTLNTEIIAVGTELLLGQIANTNAQWISETLAAHGINTYYHTVVGDNLKRLTAIFKQAESRSNVIIVTGGLGPTEDDLSREAFFELSNIPIVTDEDSITKIESFFQHQKREMTANNRRQARVFENSTVLFNKTGMAPGNIVEHKGKRWIFLPGVPREMKQLFSDEVIPYLRAINGEMIIQSTVLRFIGIGESTLEDRLFDLIQNQENPTIAPLAQKDGVTIRITAKAITIDEANILIEETKQKVLEKVGTYYYGSDHNTIEEKVSALLSEKNKTITSAESLTGGLFAEKFVSMPGVSNVFKGAVVCYTPEVKEKVLKVSHHIIQKDGTVSEPCARELAKNVAGLLDSSIGISFTGVAGPDESEGKKVGTVYIGLYDEAGYKHVEKCFFHGDRKQVRYRAVLKGYELLLNYLKLI